LDKESGESWVSGKRDLKCQEHLGKPFRIDDYIWRKFIKKCTDEGYTASDVIRALITKVLNGEINVSSLKPQKNRRGESLKDLDDATLEWFRNVKHPISSADTK